MDMFAPIDEEIFRDSGKEKSPGPYSFLLLELNDYVCWMGLQDRDLAKRKISCYQDIDNGLWGSHCRSSAINKENCALRCVSHSCYDSVYGNDHVSLTPCFPLPSFFS
jgi:hypothetical protein